MPPESSESTPPEPTADDAAAAGDAPATKGAAVLTTPRATVLVPEFELNGVQKRLLALDPSKRQFRKVLDLGPLPNDADHRYDHGVPDLDRVSDYRVYCSDPATGNQFIAPHVNTFGTGAVQVTFPAGEIQVRTNADMSKYHAAIGFVYSKSEAESA